MYGIKDLFVIHYSTKWAVRFEHGVNLKLCKTQEDAIDLARIKAKQFDADVYIEEKPGKFKKIKKQD